MQTSNASNTHTHAVIVAGGGPTGMVLAAELALAGVDVAIVERRADATIEGSRAGGLHARTLEVFDQRGIVDRFLAEGQIAQVAAFNGVKLDIGDFPTRHPYGLGLWQSHIERILAGWIAELPVRLHRGCEVVGFTQDARGVDVALADGRAMRADYLVGCDGGRSVVRKRAGIEFAGWDPTISHLIAEVQMTQAPELGIRHDARGMHGLSRLEYEIRDGEVIYKDEGPVRVMITEAQVGATKEPTLEDLRAAVVEIYGTDFGMHDPIWISRFTDATRQATTYRDRRVLIAGDAAHVHYPVGGQGLNVGVQDAMNLGWKLAQVVEGRSPDSLLDTYQAERHPVAARVVRSTMAQVALRRMDARTQAVSETVNALFSMEEPRRAMAGEMSGLGLRYDFGDGHPLLGRRMPDLDLVTAQGPTRVYAMLHDARPLLLDFDASIGIDLAPWRARIASRQARCDGPWALPVVGEVAAPTAVLVRPDGYVAWVGEGSDAGLADALAQWCGRPAAT